MSNRHNASKPSVTLALRVNSEQAEQIRIAARASNLSVSNYLYRRVTDRPMIATPRLAALAALIQTLKRMESAQPPFHELIGALDAAIVHLADLPADMDGPA